MSAATVLDEPRGTTSQPALKSRRFVLGSGDLLVMSGTCQHRFEHSVPKLTRPTAPRLSLTFRHDLSVWREASAQRSIQ